MMQWIVYYEDGSSFTSEDGPPDKAPKEGVQVVAVADIGTGKLLWHSVEVYCWQEGEWIGHSEVGLRRYLALSEEAKTPEIVLRSYAIPYRRFTEIYLKAVNDPRMPFKTANDQREPPAPSPL